MKITITPANTSDQYTIEGSIDELNGIINKLIADTPIKNVKTASSTPAIKQSTDSNKDVSKFIRSVYVYPADNKTPTGKGRYIAEILADFKVHTYSEIERKSNAITKTVNRNIAKMRAAGAKINVEGQQIQLISIPDKRFVQKRRNSIKKSSTSNALAAFAGLKLS